MNKIAWTILMAGLLLGGALDAVAQKAPRRVISSNRTTNAEEAKELARQAADSRESLLKATQAYRESLDKLLIPLAERGRMIRESLEKKRAMINEGLIARREIEPVELELAEIDGKIADTRQRMVQADQFLVEVANLELMAKQQAEKANQTPGLLINNLRYIRYTGLKAWSLREYSKIESFFEASSGRSLPVSAFGQSDTHNRLGFDHSNSFDVALHPDTAEAQKLMAYLRTQGIPFTAFRGAIPGNATGAHIHIGFPSARYR